MNTAPQKPAQNPAQKPAQKPLRVAIAGATGAVGGEIIRILEERKFPIADLALLASPKSAGRKLEAFGSEHSVQALDEFDFDGWDLGLFSPGGAVSAIHAPRAAKANCIVVDNTSHFRNQAEVPLIVPEVNGRLLADRPPRGIVANPNCCAIQLVAALKPLADQAPLKRVVADTYQAAGGAGASAMQELFEQTRGLYAGTEITPVKFQRQLAFNVIPQIDVFLDDGTTLEEWKLATESRKILCLPDLAFQATCVRVPVMVGHAIAAHLEFTQDLPVSIASAALAERQGLVVLGEDPNDYATPLEAAGTDPVFVSRLRRDASVAHGLSLWIVADNLRKGAALNTVQIAEQLAQFKHFGG